MAVDRQPIPWQVIGDSRAIHWDQSVWLDLLAECQSGFLETPWGGPEMGGLLIGERSVSEKGSAVRRNNDISITNFLPVICEHVGGPSFELTAEERRTLGNVIAAQRAAGHEVVGWWHSVSHRKPDLSAADLDLATEFFSEPWQISLIIRRSTDQPGEPFLFLWHGQVLSQAEFQSAFLPDADGKPTIDLFRIPEVLAKQVENGPDEEQQPLGEVSAPPEISGSADSIEAAQRRHTAGFAEATAASETSLVPQPPASIVPWRAEETRPSEAQVGVFGLVRLLGRSIFSSAAGPSGAPTVRRYRLKLGSVGASRPKDRSALSDSKLSIVK